MSSLGSVFTAPARLLRPVADRFDRSTPVYDTAGKTILVTGANTGIGFETAVTLATGGGRIIITSRDEQRGRAAVQEIARRTGKEVELMLLDLAEFANVRAFAASFLEAHERLDVLVNNAGVILTERSETVDGHETTYQVNHLGPFLLTNLLLDTVKASAPARIVNVSSTAHRQALGGLDFDDLEATKRYVGGLQYGRTKLMNILFTRELARRLSGTRVTANALHPGGIRSGFGQDGDARGVVAVALQAARPFLQSSREGSRTVSYLAASPDVDGVTGRYFAYRAEASVSRYARDDDAAAKLWEISARTAGLT